MNQQIIDIFKEFEIKTATETSTWFNGHGYFPYHTTKIKFSYHSWDLFILYEHKESEFTKNNSLHSAYCERHIVEISAINHSRLDLPEFKITFIDSFASLFRFGNHQVKIKCNDDLFRKEVSKWKELKLVDRLVKNGSDFYPEILGKSMEDNFEIKLNFQMLSNPFQEAEVCFNLMRVMLDKV